MSQNSLRTTIVVFVLAVAGIIMLPLLFESNNASQILIVTSPSGTVSVYESPGWHWQGFGSAVHYPRRGTYSFDVDQYKDDSMEIRFNDSGTAKLTGVLNYELSANAEQVKELHSQYLTPEAVEQQLIRSFLQMSIFNTGGLLSSTESYSSSRGYMFEVIQKQLSDGIYATDGTLTREKDGLGFERTITKIQVRKSSDGEIAIATESPFKKFGIIVQSLNIRGIKYDEKVNGQIQAQLDATIKVQTAIAEAKKAEQDKITAEQKGLADRAEAEAAANVILAKETIDADRKKVVAITEAEQKKEVAELALEEAKLKAQAIVEEGKAQAEARKLAMEADGALQMKMEAYVKSQEAWARAYAESRQPHSPVVVTGGGSSVTGAASLMEMIGAKAALDLGVSLKAQQTKAEQDDLFSTPAKQITNRTGDDPFK